MEDKRFIRDLVSEGESESLEFKAIVNKESIAKVLCSFLNGDGGRIIVGLTNEGELVGIPDAKSQAQKLSKYLLEAIVPEAPVNLVIESLGEKDFLILKVYGGASQPYLFDGSVYFRKGASTVKATSQQLSELIHERQKSDQHWERKTAMGLDLEDLDERLIQSVINEAQKNYRTNFEGNDALDFLSHYGLFQNGSFTNACVVLFARNPARFLPQVRVRLTEYQESKTDQVLLRDELLEDNLFLIQDRLERYINNLGIRSVFESNQWKRADFKFPPKALQEGVINALMHRDYTSPSSSVSISIYPDRFVVSNSGHLPDGLKVSELKKSHRSHPVNPDIAHVVFLRGLIDKLGRGTIKVVEECREAGLKDPVWKETKDGVTLTFNGPRALPKKSKLEDDGVSDGVDDGVNDGSTLAMAISTRLSDGVNDGVIEGVSEGVRIGIIQLTKIIQDQEGIRVNEIVERSDKSKPTIERYLNIARAIKLLEFKGAPKTGGYYITDSLKKKLTSKD